MARRARPESKVQQRWSTKSHSKIENIRQANARLREFALSDTRSPSVSQTENFLDARSSLAQEFKVKKGNRTIWYTGYREEYRDLSPKELSQQNKSIEGFLQSDTSTISKYDKVLRKQYNTFTQNHNINRRKFTFNQYKQLFENYEQMFDPKYEDSHILVEAIVAHSFLEGRKATEDFINELVEHTDDDKNYEKVKEYYNLRFEKAEEIGWEY